MPESESDTPLPPVPTLRSLRRLLDLTLIVLLILLLLIGSLYGFLRSRASEYDGEIHLSGLQANVSIARDEHGVAHISAQNEHDLFLAEGYAMAQDRLWQMDVMRRAGEGELSEIFGTVALATDIESRTLGMNRAIEAESKRIPTSEASALDAFADGVNLYIRRHGLQIPLEFVFLHYRPRPWVSKDTLAIAAYMFHDLASGYQNKLVREAFSTRIGEVAAAEIFPDRSRWDILPGALTPLPKSRRPSIAQSPALPVFVPDWNDPLVYLPSASGGSNSWALSGVRTFSGAPILANDPHLRYQVPGVWWAAELNSPGLQVAGVTLPGVPGIVIGHNRNIAWGITSVRADVQDLYREHINDQGEVQTNTGWVPLQHWVSSIKVRGHSPYSLNVQVTPQGPIVAHDGGGPLALAWTLYSAGALQADLALLDVDRSSNWGEFEQALSEFPGPPQNFVYADQAGHIGYQAAGWVPARITGDGSVPYPSVSEFRGQATGWNGWIPFSAMPHVEDPPGGLIVTANGRITSYDAPAVISTDWDAPYRTYRIVERLTALPRWNASAMGNVQQDVISDLDADFAAALVAAQDNEIARGHQLNALTRQSVNLLRNWRGAMGRATLQPTLAVETRREVMFRVLAARAGAALARRYDWDSAPVFVETLLDTRPPEWLPPEYRQSGWDAFLLDCLSVVASRHPLNTDSMRWGLSETLRVPQLVLTHVPLLHRISDLGPVEINGSPLTVKQARNTTLGNRLDLGPSMRIVDDLADWDRSTLTLFSGESGDVFSPYYRDQFPNYLNGRALPLWFSEQAVHAHTAHTLSLLP